jgi:colanic acid/amylovoran biosynthesis glycosyltransferase
MTVATMHAAENVGATSQTAQSLPRIAYLTTEYPKVSHTFIRREIEELERRGHEITRISIRKVAEALSDAADVEEDRRTFYCLSRPLWELIQATIVQAASHPIRWWRAFRAMLAMHRRSDRGLIAHVAYLVEACVLARYLQRMNIDHVHVHFGTNSAAVARLIHILGGPPYSVTVHGPNEFDAPHGLSLAEKLAVARFIVAISDFCAAQIRRWLPHEHWHKIHIVRCTVGSQFFGKSQPIRPECRTLLCIGRLSAQKGQHVLIEAMSVLGERGINGQLILAGDGEMRHELESHIARRNLESHVTITGWIDEQRVRELLQSSRALVQPSFAEGLPVVIMESLAMARPVIATMVAGIPELVRDGENGWLVAAGSVEDLAKAMEGALAAPVERLNEMGLAGRERVRQMHFTPNEVERLHHLFRDLPVATSAAVSSDAHRAVAHVTS